MACCPENISCGCSHCAARTAHVTLFQPPSTAALSAIFTHYSLTRAQVGKGHAGPLSPVLSCAGTPAGPGCRRLRRSAPPMHRPGPAAALDEIGAAHLAPRRYQRPAPRALGLDEIIAPCPLPRRNRRPNGGAALVHSVRRAGAECGREALQQV